MGTLGITHGGHEPNPLTRPSATLSPSDGEREKEFGGGVPGAALRSHTEQRQSEWFMGSGKSYHDMEFIILSFEGRQFAGKRLLRFDELPVRFL